MAPIIFQDPEYSYRKITSRIKHPDIEFDPNNIDKFFIGNVFEPRFSHLFGYDGKVWRPVSVSNSGKLENVISGTGYDEYAVHTFSGISSDTIHDFGEVYDKIYVDLTAGNMQLEIDTGDGTFGNIFYINAKGSMWLPVNCERVRYDDDGATVSGRITVFK